MCREGEYTKKSRMGGCVAVDSERRDEQMVRGEEGCIWLFGSDILVPMVTLPNA